MSRKDVAELVAIISNMDMVEPMVEAITRLVIHKPNNLKI